MIDGRDVNMRHTTQRITRRRLISWSGAGILGAAGAPYRAGAASNSRFPETKELVYVGYGGSYEQGIKQAYFGPFAAKTGVQVLYTTGAGNIAKIAAEVNSGRPEWDLVDFQGSLFGSLLDKNLIEPLDRSVVTVKPSDLVSPAYYHPYSIASYVFSHNVFWNKKAIPNGLTSWHDVWDVQRFPGKRGFSKGPQFNLEIALLADGVPKDKLYPLDVDRAFRSLDKIKPYAVFQDLNTLNNLFAQQEIVTGDLNLARVKALAKAGVPLDYTWNEAMLDVERLVVLRGARNALNAMRAIEFVFQVPQQLAMLKALGYGPTVKSAVERIDPEQAKDIPGSRATIGKSFIIDGVWWGRHADEVMRRFNTWLIS
jgi:putative spermidine/putrescine transport system substrate-binding protein